MIVYYLPELNTGIFMDHLGKNVVGICKNMESITEVFGASLHHFKDTWLSGVFATQADACNALTSSALVPVDLNNFPNKANFLHYINELLPVLSDPNTPMSYHCNDFLALYDSLDSEDALTIQQRDFTVISYLNCYERAKRNFDLNLTFSKDNYHTLPHEGTAKELYSELASTTIRELPVGTKILPYLKEVADYKAEAYASLEESWDLLIDEYYEWGDDDLL